MMLVPASRHRPTKVYGERPCRGEWHSHPNNDASFGVTSFDDRKVDEAVDPHELVSDFNRGAFDVDALNYRRLGQPGRSHGFCHHSISKAEGRAVA